MRRRRGFKHGREPAQAGAETFEEGAAEVARRRGLSRTHMRG